LLRNALFVPFICRCESGIWRLQTP